MTLNLTGYRTCELKQVADLDCFAVRDEAYSRQAIALKKLDRLARQRATLLAELAELGLAITAATQAQRAEEAK